MSAFLVSSKHVAVLAAYACVNQLVIPEWSAIKNKHSLVANVAIELMKENMRSIESRYPNDEDDNIADKLTLYECAEEADKQIEDAELFKSVYIFKLVESFAYQACECDDWEETKAYKQYLAITHKAAKDALFETKEYNSAPWEV